MVITKLMGGLGNQMFQYAAGLATARRTNSPLYLDAEWFKVNRSNSDVTPRVYELGCFDIKPAKISPLDRWRLKRQPALTFKEAGKRLTEFRQLSGNVILYGYWQNAEYFRECEDEVRQAFQFRRPLPKPALSLVDEIKASYSSVAIHVRRGDYVSNQRAASVLGALDAGYYQRAIKKLAEKIGQPSFYVFSDDIAWCRKNLGLKKAGTFVEDLSASQDLQLMAACQHQIIANSSFSWWGAWLNNSSNKIIIAPKKWFNNRPSNTSLAVPSDWLKL